MSDYIIKLLPTKEKPIKGQFMHNGFDSFLCTDTNHIEGIVKCEELSGWLNMDSFKLMKFFLCSTHDINEGNEVAIAYTDGEKEVGSFDIGILTSNIEDEPWCALDGRGIDLASEGHSSNMYKIICEIDWSNLQWITDGMEFSKEQVRLTSEWESKRSKQLEEGDEVEIQTHTKSAFSMFGKIKIIKRKNNDEWDWDDEVEITNVTQQKINPYGGDFITDSFPDIKTKLDKVRGKRYVVITCLLQCPTCKHFH